ncbi:uncharacterized protein LOC131881695 [Tigriopus californicus]|uniref:uncharacterized protein LOC131881695 n=1 Tax=Tigriopus californicus TaxID=6832 RepID=UPI0027DA4694|nr:uncharacterized protein LOC131881695 [Tigriopus californicus]
MAHRDEIQVLKASRRGFKAALTRARNVAESALEDFSVGDDPVLLENFICHWDERLHKYLNAEDQVICHLSSDVKDADPAVDEHTSAFIKAKSQVTGLSRDFDAIRLRNLTVPIQTSSGSNHGHGQTTPGLPRIDAKRPPVLQEDTDHKAFTRWRPLWNNYSRLTFLDQRDQAIQVGLFWECCSGGFLRIVNHSLGIRTDTGRPVKEILDLIEDHLRSLRNVHLDMRDLLAVRQKEGQDYTSFCNIIRELSDYADASKVTEDRLLIALLLQGMRNDSDKAKIMERNPNTFDEARRYILELETARKENILVRIAPLRRLLVMVVVDLDIGNRFVNKKGTRKQAVSISVLHRHHPRTTGTGSISWYHLLDQMRPQTCNFVLIPEPMLSSWV